MADPAGASPTAASEMSALPTWLVSSATAGDGKGKPFATAQRRRSTPEAV